MRRYMTRSLPWLLMILVSTSILPTTAAAQGYTVTVNGSAVPGAMAEMRAGQLMVAVRPFVEAMGGGVDWLQSDRRATTYYGGSQLAFWIGSNTSFKNGQRLWAPVAPYLKDGKTMVPAWWLVVQLGGDVQFANSTLTVRTKATQSAPFNHPLKNPSYFFPFPQGATYQPYGDGYGDGRSFNGASFPHEGIDILAAKGTPVVAVAAGKVVRYGWNTLGGYRITIALDDYPEYRFYYAHLDRYAPGLYEGAHVRAGQVIGYVGSTGEGPERTEGKFVTHLHFGIYNPDGSAMNPYALLKFWEQHKVKL